MNGLTKLTASLSLALAANLAMSLDVFAAQGSTPDNSAILTQSAIQFAPGQAKNQPPDVDLVEKTVLRALELNVGDPSSLQAAQSDFTPQAWSKFIHHMDGYLDARGAPLFNQKFTPTEKPVLVNQKNGVMSVAMQGLLEQTSALNKATAINSRASYRAVIYVQVGGSPMKIQNLEQTTCGTGTGPCPILPTPMNFP